MKPWVKWCINHNLKFIVYIVWLIALPLFLLTYIGKAMEDARSDLTYIKSVKKGS